MNIGFDFDNEPVPVFQLETYELSDKDDDSAASENIDNINKDLFCARVDIRIKLLILDCLNSIIWIQGIIPVPL